MWRRVHTLAMVGEDRQASTHRIRELASRAIALDPRDGEARFALGMYYALELDTDAAMREFTAGLALSPSNAFGYTRRGFIHALQGSAEQALEDVAIANSLSPLDPTQRASRHAAGGYASFRLGRYEQAYEFAREQFRIGGNFGAVHAAVYACKLGNQEAARYWLEQVQAVTPWLSLEVLRRLPALRKDQAWDDYVDTLASLGMPERTDATPPR